ncbi:bifunctional 2-dehydro-3-deoxy-phosphogluconate/2-dehydro-3-deoxy-6-phos phogalactonate aldolase [Sulfurisphaera javensis]|uniref:2-dehydro-3-deoxy-phosphogluconate/2-dehydro-3-deoxy-6-phosphogalactonate aldolase n=1 Tax=Sulfurisphaera javensis TaxID=2049879 RepID=A0AAT9GQ40_9CREN
MEIVTPILTPFTKEGEVDVEKLKNHAKYLIENGIDILFVNGTTGLGPALSKEEKLKNLKAIYDVTNKIIFQVGSLNINDVIDLVKASKDYDIIGIASYPPYYFPRIPEKMILKYFLTISKYSPHPLYLYNYPLATGYDISAKTLYQIKDIMTGLKDTNQDLAHSLEYKILMPNLKVYNGSDSLVYYSLLSLDGSVTAVSNYLPHLMRKMKEYISKKELDKAIELQKLVNKVLDISRKYGQLSSIYYLVKEFLGYDVGYPRGPIFPLEDDEVKALLNEVQPIKKEIERLVL